MTSLKVKGKIVNAKPLKNNTFIYFIEDNKGATEKYIFFADSKFPDGLDNSREITVEYEIIHNEKYGPSNKIKNVINYGDFITDQKLINDFLVNRVGLTKNFVNKLIETYGNNTLDVVFKNTKKLKEINHKNLDDMLALINEYKKNNIQLEFCIELSKIGIVSKYHRDIINKMGTDIQLIKESMYDLYTICKVPFKICDACALKLNYKKDNDDRINAFIIMLYKQFNGAGTLYETKDCIEQISIKYQIPIDLIIPKLVSIDVGKIKYYTTEKIYNKEIFVEEICNKLINQNPVTKIDFNEEWYIEHTQLDAIQRIAVKNVLKSSISIITGAPGTGKSYIIKEAASKLRHKNKIYILAPTGAAVERLRSENMEKTIGAEIRTLQSFVFCHTKFKKEDEDTKDLPYTTVNDLYNHTDEFIFFIDEMSMVDLSLFYNFIEIISDVIDKVRIVLLGDKNQLPSINGGCILNDLISSQRICCTTLKYNHRSKSKSGEINDIMENAELVLQGKNLKENSKNVIVINSAKASNVKKNLIEIIKKHSIRYQNSCILIPTRKKGICINVFNPILQHVYNPKKEDNDIGEFRIGDKIMHGKNNKKKEIYNGSILVVNDVNYNEKNQPIHMTCKYYSTETDIDTNDTNYRMIEYKSKNEKDKNDFHEGNLDLAYAMTVHKAQGKGYDTVIIIVHSSMYGPMLNKNLFYTAITRAKQKCIIIADEGGLLECKKPMQKRITNLYRSAKVAVDNLINQNIFDIMMTIRNNLDKYLESKELCELMTTNNINVLNLKDKNQIVVFNRELTIFHNAVLKNDDLFYKLLAFNDAYIERKKINNGKIKIIDV